MNDNEAFRGVKLIFDMWNSIALDIHIVSSVVKSAHQRHLVSNLFRFYLYFLYLYDSVPWRC